MNAEEKKMRDAAPVNERRRIAELARTRYEELRAIHGLTPPTFPLTDDMFHLPKRNRGYHYCIICHKHDKFALRKHIRTAHPQFVPGSDEFKVMECVSLSVTESLKGVSFDLSKLPPPTTAEEKSIYDMYCTVLYNAGIPTTGNMDYPAIGSCPTAERHDEERRQVPRFDTAMPSTSSWTPSQAEAIESEVQEMVELIAGQSITVPKDELMFANEYDDSDKN